ncbi:MAG: hypothetical protein V1722_01330 [Candidatus Micrarchaeota archaeon]
MAEKPRRPNEGTPTLSTKKFSFRNELIRPIPRERLEKLSKTLQDLPRKPPKILVPGRSGILPTPSAPPGRKFTWNPAAFGGAIKPPASLPESLRDRLREQARGRIAKLKGSPKPKLPK